MATFKATFKNSANLKATFGEVQRVSTSNYEELTNKPKINGVELVGNKTSSDIHVQDRMNEITDSQIDELFMSWIRG